MQEAWSNESSRCPSLVHSACCLSKPFCGLAGSWQSRLSMTKMRCQSKQDCNHGATLPRCLDAGHKWEYHDTNDSMQQLDCFGAQRYWRPQQIICCNRIVEYATEDLLSLIDSCCSLHRFHDSIQSTQRLTTSILAGCITACFEVLV